ncbi:MAG: hypothetical protein ACD_48C00676G0002 [uncultured bacterium]|nr:MAG: hypothetical protein ACD_48C00676G0002 [uncultured bacterium]
MTYAPLHSNDSSYIYRRKKLRKNSTKAEQVLWQEVRAKKLGYKFRRQFQIGIYIVDFYCKELNLVIELDGPIHAEQEAYDKKRQTWLETQGVLLVRYLNDEVLFDRDAVMQHLIGQIEKRKNPV